MNKQIISGPEALIKILAGVNLIADAVKRTLGPDGRNCVYERVQTNQPVSTRDGVTVANQIEAADPHEQMGVAMLQGVAREAVDQSGDGTTTATLLAQAVFREGVKAITVGANPVALKRGIEKATMAVVDQLRSMSRPVVPEMVAQVATISANNDPFLGGLIAEAMRKAGDDGVVTVEISRSAESSLQIVDGLQFGTGFVSRDFVNRPERNECVLEDVTIFLHERKLTSIKDLLPAIQAVAQEGKSFLVIAEEVTDEALGILAVNTQRGLLKACAVRTPGGVEHLHDIAALTGGSVMTELSNQKLRDLTPAFFGHAAKVVVKPTTTTVYADARENPGLNTRLAELRQLVLDAQNENERLRLQARLARLAGGIAIIRVGGSTELEMLERKDRLEDAMHATRCAQKEGVLPGGGIALLRASDVCERDLFTGDEIHGAKILQLACFAPLKTLAENAGESSEYVLKTVQGRECGWNARKNEYGDMFEMGIIDPLRVVRVALESAASVAGLMLITHCLVSNGREK